MTPAVAIIPTIGASPLIYDLVDELLLAGISHIWLYDNWTGKVGYGPGERTPEDGERLDTLALHRGVRLRRVDQSIYQSWNEGMDDAAQRGYSVAHILNDDIVIRPAAIKRVTDLVADGWALVGYDHSRQDVVGGCRPVTGTYRHGGIGGFAFAVNPTLCARVHPGFRWWGGDDDLVNGTNELHPGRVGIANGARVEHPLPSTSSVKYPLTEPWHDEDRKLLLERWGEAW